MMMTRVRLEEEHFKKFNDTMGKCGLRLVTLRDIMLYFQYLRTSKQNFPFADNFLPFSRQNLDTQNSQGTHGATTRSQSAHLRTFSL